MNIDKLNLNKYYAFEIKSWTQEGRGDWFEVILKSDLFWTPDKTIEFSRSTDKNIENYNKFIEKLMRHFYPEEHYEKHDAKVISKHWDEIKDSLIKQETDNNGFSQSKTVDDVTITYGLAYRHDKELIKLKDELTIANHKIESLKRQLIEAQTEVKILQREKAA